MESSNKVVIARQDQNENSPVIIEVIRRKLSEGEHFTVIEKNKEQFMTARLHPPLAYNLLSDEYQVDRDQVICHWVDKYGNAQAGQFSVESLEIVIEY